jgi:signal transduction histidine kinase
VLKPPFNSIQQRLSLGLVSVIILVGLLLAQISLWVFDQGLRRYLNTHLQQETETLLAALVRGANGIELDQQRIGASYRRPFSGLYFYIEFEQQQWRSRSLWDHPFPSATESGLHRDLAVGPSEQQLLVYRAQFRRFGKAIDISVAQDYTPMLDNFRRLQWIAAGLGLAALIVLVLLQRYLVARALRPLEKMRVQIAQLQQGQRSTLDSDVPDELLALVVQLNRLSQHTEERLKRSRNALGNLGHALKTPLAILFSLANRSELNSQPVLRENLRNQLQQMQERISRELARARLAGEALPGAHFHCAAELPDLINTLKLIHRRELQIHWAAAPELRLPWDREDILELLGNLLDNACKWARQKVQVSITHNLSQQHFELIVEDDGPGIAEPEREQVLSRGTRIDEQVQGHGLGLGIVRDIVEYCGGEISLQQSSLGGLAVVIHLPASHS